MWVFKSRRYPIVDNSTVREVKLRLMGVLFSEDIPDPRDILLISLSDVCGIFSSLLSNAELDAAAGRIGRVRKLDLMGREVTNAVREIEASLAHGGGDADALTRDGPVGHRLSRPPRRPPDPSARDRAFDRTPGTTHSGRSLETKTMDVMTERQEGVLTAQVGGRIDGSNVAQFEEAIRTAIDESDRAVLIDCENLGYISSAGAARRADDRQEPVEPERQVRAVLHVGSDPGSLPDQRFRQDRRDPPVQGRGPRLLRFLTWRSFPGPAGASIAPPKVTRDPARRAGLRRPG